MRKASLIAALLVMSAGAVRPAAAQLAWTVYGVGEFDTEDVIYALAGLNLGLSRPGIVPVANLQGFLLQYPDGTGDTRVLGITPSLGLAYNFTGGTLAGRVGYTFADGDQPSVSSVTADVGEGTVGTGHLEYWGTGGLGAQAIASHNFGSETLWARGRLTHRLMGYGSDGAIRIGGEVAYLDTPNFKSIMPGVLVGFNPSVGTAISLGVGRKLNEQKGLTDLARDATYFKVEIALSPGN